MPTEKTNQKKSSDRRITKPIMEKKRRARINQSLTELKSFLMSHSAESEMKDKKKSKFEKADILEMTVKYLRSEETFGVVGQQNPAIDDRNQLETDQRLVVFEDGFAECARNVVNFLNSCCDDGRSSSFGGDVKARLLRYLRQRWLQISRVDDDDLEEKIVERHYGKSDECAILDLSRTSSRLFDDDLVVVDWSRYSPISDRSDVASPDLVISLPPPPSSSSPSPPNCSVSSTTSDSPIGSQPIAQQMVQKLLPVGEDSLWRPW